MPITIYITDDFEHMSHVGAEIVKGYIARTLKQKDDMVLGLATGNSPTGLYKHLAQAANTGELDSRRIRSFNLDEYVGLPGENAQQRILHRESYCFFMIGQLFSRLEHKFIASDVPGATLIEQAQLIQELKAYPEDWREAGAYAGCAIVIRNAPASPYLAWIRTHILDGYERQIQRAGGIDLQIIGVGGRGHVAFHESGIPFNDSKMLLVKLDDNTVSNAVADGHFASMEECPRYAVSMGAELVYQAKTVVLLANGERKIEALARSLLDKPTPDVPISYGQIYSERGGDLYYVIDKVAAQELLASRSALEKKGVEILFPQNKIN
ncbi:6-phosphogluconolactonase [Desulfovibrio sp. OttesenSCG-928-M16]|nr:6-phosphogluconolactonase [Desulfovibrio sp. OttesenSCG-928-M16]